MGFIGRNYEWFANFWSPIFASMIAIIGVGLSVYFNLKISKNNMVNENEKQIKKIEEQNKQFINDVKKIQVEYTIEKISEAQEIITRWIFEKKDPVVDDMLKLKTLVYKYASNKSVEIISDLTQFNYKMEIGNADDSATIMAYYCILMSSLRNDITGEWTNPKNVLRILLNDYDEGSLFSKKINQLQVEYYK